MKINIYLTLFFCIFVFRTLTDLLKQPAQIDFLSDGHRGSVQVQITEVIPRISPRNSIGEIPESFHTFAYPVYSTFMSVKMF